MAEEPHSFKVYAPATTALPADGSFHLVNFGSESYDHGNNFASSKFIAPSNGLYQFECQLLMTTVSNLAFGEYSEMYFEKTTGGSASTHGRTIRGADGTNVMVIRSIDTLELAVGDEVEVYVKSVGKAAVLNNTVTYSWFSGRQLS